MPWISSVYKQDQIHHYEIGPQYTAISADLDNKEEGTPFLVYFDRRERWGILCDIAKEVKPKNRQLFYVACQDSNDKEPVEVESFEMEYKEPSSLSEMVYIEVFDGGKISFFGKEYPDCTDSNLIDDIEAFSNKNTSCLLFLRGAEDLSVERFINILAHIEGCTDLDIYITSANELK